MIGTPRFLLDFIVASASGETRTDAASEKLIWPG
jgi:hypothetical protein